MSEDGAAGKRSSPRLTSAYAKPTPPGTASRETTLGGIQKVSIRLFSISDLNRV